MAGYNKNPIANKEVLDLLAELGRPATQAEIADRLRIDYPIVQSRLTRLRAAGDVKSQWGANHRQLLWSLKKGGGRNGDGFVRRSPAAALPAVERAVAAWYRSGPTVGALNGE